MAEIETRPRGILINRIAPQIDTLDVYGKEFNLYKALEKYDGVLIDFFRGAW